MKTKAFYCVSTHWDREWYEPFQEFRMWLVEVVDEVMDLLDAHPEFKCFHLDGQAVVLEDYLAIRPERKDQFVRLLKEGRLKAGPWYVLPDEWLVSGESYIRNILVGMGACRELGFEPMKFAYTPDQFGHIAALPTIMTGMGLKAGIVWRGTTDETFPPQFVWVGPDGSRMVTHKLFDEAAYGWLFYKMRNMEKVEHWEDEKMRAMLEGYIEKERGRIQVPLMLIMDGNDHQHANASMIDIFKGMRERYPDMDFVWGGLDEYGEAMLANADQLPERTGELREPCIDDSRACQYLIVHVISSRYNIKKRNDECQALLEKWVEPYVLFHALSGGDPVMSYVKESWKYLLKNHPHDSICGCSIDQVHRDMLYRFDQSEMMADSVLRRALAAVGNAAIPEGEAPAIVLHNPLPHHRSGVFELNLTFPGGWPKKFTDGLTAGEAINRFDLVTASGETVPYQLLSIERGAVTMALKPNGGNQWYPGDTYRLAVEMDLPACGHTSLSVKPTDRVQRNVGTQLVAKMTADNGAITFELDPSGLGYLTHNASLESFEGLFCYEDSADSGDGWTRGQVTNDVVYQSPGDRVMVSIVEDGALRTVFMAERELTLPAYLDKVAGKRSTERKVLHITDRYILEKGKPYLRVQTTVDNVCMDHRLRVLMPTVHDVAVSFAETPFAVVERDVDAPAEAAAWRERWNPEKAFSTFFGVTSPETDCGLAVLAPAGLHEYAVLPTWDHPLALTLLRATRQTVGTAGEPDGELQGRLTFEYALMPFQGAFDPALASRSVAEMQAGVRWHGGKELTPDVSFLEVEGDDLVVTAVKRACQCGAACSCEPGTTAVVRLWNPGDATASGIIKTALPVNSASLCNLAEEKLGDLEVKDGGVTVEVAPRAIASVLLRFA